MFWIIKDRVCLNWILFVDTQMNKKHLFYSNIQRIMGKSNKKLFLWIFLCNDGTKNNYIYIKKQKMLYLMDRYCLKMIQLQLHKK